MDGQCGSFNLLTRHCFPLGSTKTTSLQTADDDYGSPLPLILWGGATITAVNLVGYSQFMIGSSSHPGSGSESSEFAVSTGYRGDESRRDSSRGVHFEHQS